VMMSLFKESLTPALRRFWMSMIIIRAAAPILDIWSYNNIFLIHDPFID
jgi:hypothetical protein